MRQTTFEIRVPRTSGAPLTASRRLWEVLHRESVHDGGVFEFYVVRQQGALRCFFTVPERLVGFFQDQAYALLPEVEIIAAERPFGENARRVRLILEDDFTARFRTVASNTPPTALDPADALFAPLGKHAAFDAAFRFIAVPLEEFPGPDRVSELMEGPQPYEGEPITTDNPVYSSSPGIRGFLQVFTRNVWRIFLWVSGFRRRASVRPTAHEHTWHRPQLRASKREAPLFSINIELVSEGIESPEVTTWEADMVRALNGSFDDTEARWEALNPAFDGVDAWERDGYGVVAHTGEVALFAHLPTTTSTLPGVAWVRARPVEPPTDLPFLSQDQVPVACAVWRGSGRAFGLSPEDRLKHMYVVGKTGMGKTTLLENMLLADVEAGRGAGVVDPHGDMVESVLARLPKSRTNDLVIFDPADAQWPVGFNLLELPDPRMGALVASSTVGVFKKMFADSWGPRLEYVLRNVILTLLATPAATLLHVPLVLTDAQFRARAVGRVTDPVLRRFWETEFAQIAGNRSSDALGPILNKVGQFLSNPVVRNVVGQPKSGFTPRWVMDHGKILLVNLSKGRLGEDASALLGSLLVTKFQLDAMSRAMIAPHERRDYFLYIDEFQNFATDSFATTLSEARKYRLGLTLAHQYVDQLPKPVADAVFGNIGTAIAFQVGHPDAQALAPLFGDPRIAPDDLANVPRYEAYCRTLANGRSLPPFRVRMFPPRPAPDRAAEVETLKKVNREKFARSREFVEGKIDQLHRE